MRLLKLLLIVLAYCHIGTSAHCQYVQPMGYKDYSFWGDMNIGNNGAKLTNSSAYLELGKPSGSKKGLLLPRGNKDSVVLPTYGLLFWNNPDSALYYYNGAAWVNISSGGSGSGANNYPSTIDYTGDVFTMGRNGLGNLTANIPLSIKLNKTDTTSKWLNNVYKRNDSIFFRKGPTETFAFKDNSSTSDPSNYQAFASVSALKASTFYGDGKAAKILDGGREFAWNSESLASDDNGVTTIKLTGIPAGAYERIFSGVVRAAEVGVKSDGTNQTTLLNSLLSLSTVKEILFDNGDVTISGTVNFQNKKANFQNNARLIGAGTVKNMQVIADRKSTIFATTLNTDAGILTKPVSIMWWGALPQADYYTGNGIDNYNAIIRAIASQKLQTSVFIPGADTTDGNLGYYYYSSRPIPVENRVELYGDGAGRSIIYIPGDSLGLWLKWGSSGSHLHDFAITGNYGSNSPGFNSTTAHGIWVNSNSNIIERVTVQYFSGDGIFINGDVGGTPYTNANNNKIKDVFVYENGRHGLDFQGGDANNCSVENVDATGNAQVNIADRSFLGNRFSACHAASAAIDHPLNKSVVTHGGSYYLAKENSLGIEPGVTSGWQTYWELKSPFSPSFSAAWNSGTQYYQTAGYLASDPNQLGHFDDCYAEGDQIIVVNKGSSTFMSGFAAAYGSTDGSIGSRQGILTSKNYQVWNFITGNGLRLDAGNLSLQWVDDAGSYPMGFTGSAAAGTISTTWANGAAGSANTFFATPTWAGAPSFLGRDRGIQGNHVHLIQQGGALIGTHDYGSTARLIAFGAAAPTSGDFGIGDVVVNTNPASSVLMWQCSTASVTGNGGTWTAVNKGGSGGETLAQTLALGNSTGTNDIAVEWASANRKIDFRYDASFNQGIEFQTAERTMKLYSNTGDAVGGDIILSPENRLGVRTPSAPSYDVDVYGSASATNGIYLNAGAGYTGVPNPGSVQGVILNVRGLNLGNAGVTLGSSYRPNLGIGITDNSSTPLVGLKQSGGGTAITVESGAIRQIPLAGTGNRLAVLDANGDMVRSTVDPASIGGGTTTNALTFNNSGSGDASGSTFNGSAAKTLSYNSIGAQPTLVSGTTIKTVNGNSLLGSGDISISTQFDGSMAGLSINNSTSTTLSNTAVMTVYAGSADATWTLPTISSTLTKTQWVKNGSSFNLTVQRNGSDAMYNNGSITSIVLAPGESRGFININATWYVYFDGSITGGSMVYPGAGIPVSTGSAWGTSLTAPSGAIVGTADAQTLTNKDLTSGTNTFPTLNQSTTGSAATLTTTRTIWGQNFNGSANVTGDITLGTASITLTGSIGATGARATKVWAADAEFTNMPTINGTSLSSSTSTLTNKTIASATNNVEGTLVNVRFLTSGTTYTPTSGTTKALIVMIGAGGGGGGVTGAATSVGAAGGGGAGGYCVKFITGVTGTYTYAIGTAGTAGANTGGTGGNGGNTTFANGATTYTAFGGSGGVGQTAGTAAAFVLGGAGAVVSTNGDINAGGSPGLMAYRVSGTLGYSGTGGDTEYGGAGIGLTSAAAGSAATGYGAGGGGALSTANTARAGGAGAPGLIIIYEYK
jgi:hypothetical protein